MRRTLPTLSRHLNGLKMKNIFAEQIEQQAIERIRKFAKIANAMKFEISVGYNLEIICNLKILVYLCIVQDQEH